MYTYSYLPIHETEKIYDSQGLNPLSTDKEYRYVYSRSTTRPDYRLLGEESTIDSKGRNLTTWYGYPLDFPNSTSNLTDAVANALAAMPAKNMLSYPVEMITHRDGKVIDAMVKTYAKFGTVIRPFQIFKRELTQPLLLSNYTHPFYSSNSQSNATFVVGASLQTTYNSYDSAGNILSIIGEGNTLTSYQWGYNKSSLVAKTVNAVPSEVFSSNFEEDKMVTTAAADVPGTWNTNGYLKFEAKPSDPNHPSTRNAAHTGQLAGAMYTNYQGEQAHAFSTTLILPAQSNSRKYVFSGWVYTNGPAASIWLFPNLPSAQNADGTINYYNGAGNSARPELFPSYASTEVNVKPDQIGRWVYLQKEVEIPGDATLLTLRITNFWNGAGSTAASINGGGVWFDDVRMHPAEAQMTTYTHQLGVGITSMSDSNNQPTYYEYDGLQRLQVVRDQNENIVKHLEYHYQR